MQCMLDTDHCVYLVKRSPLIVPLAPMNDCFISAIVAGELQVGVAKSHESRREQNRLALLDFSSMVRILSVDEQVVETYGYVRAYLEANGQRIGPHDTWIAAHALALELPLVTNNVREFSRVPELVIDNWLQNDG